VLRLTRFVDLRFISNFDVNARPARPRRQSDQLGAALFANENKDAGGQRYNVEEENGWSELQAES
jgi:hypothetical protein